MTEVHDPTPSQAPTDLDIAVESLSSTALARLIDEVRNEGGPEPASITTYNRTYHRHNR